MAVDSRLSLGDSLAKLQISYESGPAKRPVWFNVPYNPSRLSRSRSVMWDLDDDAYDDYFKKANAENLSLQLMFDTYEAGTDVTRLTSQVAALAEIETELHHPPICRLSWGTQADVFTGVMSSLNQDISMFLPDGTPVRATLDCSFTEFITTAKANAAETHSADVVKTRTVVRGETLQSLAAQEYRDPGMWREIARANGIVNARTVAPGTRLIIPKLAG